MKQRTSSPFHEGELAVQERLGVREKTGRFAARVVRDYMPDQHRDFYNALPFIFIGAVDQEGWPWASILAGPAGFMMAPDARTLEIRGVPTRGDPLWSTLRPGTDIGLLGLQLESRRRNRMNGSIKALDGVSMSIAVHQAYGNCPQYIHRRSVAVLPEFKALTPRASQSEMLEGRAASLIARADTMFIASVYAGGTGAASSGVDVSHRGGLPGFVEIVDEHTIILPDYSGNNHFNTIGNLVLNPRVGLLFVDFDTGDLVHVSGEAEIIWDGPDVDARKDAQRLVKCNIRSVRFLERALPLVFKFVDYSPSFSQT